MSRASRAASRPGSASASSYAFVCSDCVPPNTAAIASIVVRTMLFSGCCAASVRPDVWQCIRNASALRERAPSRCAISDHSSRAARSFAISPKKSRPTPKKKLSREQQSSALIPRASSVST